MRQEKPLVETQSFSPSEKSPGTRALALDPSLFLPTEAILRRFFYTRVSKIRYLRLHPSELSFIRAGNAEPR